MSTSHDLQRAFVVYLEEMERCAKAECGWALLHLVLVLPDVCAALETYNGESSGLLYEDWCGRYLPKDTLKPTDRYKLRCAVLHLGSTLPLARSRYRDVTLSSSAAASREIHQQIGVNGKDIAINVNLLADEMVAGLRAWMDDLQLAENENLRRTVDNNLRSLARFERRIVGTRTHEAGVSATPDT